ncbi:CGGC domain-containing protein [Planctomycetota bacterium]
MIDVENKDYIIIVQCHIVKERCPGYLCEKAFNERSGGFAVYPQEKKYRILNMTCGGCCGRAVHRKLSNLIRRIKKKEGIDRDRIVVQLSSCITQDNFHASPCPHFDYLKGLLKKLELDVCEDTVINGKSEMRRKSGPYTAINK